MRLLIFSAVLLASTQLLAQESCHELVWRKISGEQPETIQKRLVVWLDKYFPEGFQGSEAESIWSKLKLEPELNDEADFMLFAIKGLLRAPENEHGSYFDEIILDNQKLNPEFIWGDGGAAYSAVHYKKNEYLKKIRLSFPPTPDQAIAFKGFSDCYKEIYPPRKK
ncbi:hypothetical protein SNR37_003591 [Agarivorans aestuarii]|uniref:Uncharacterized protein n=1 Tax=Agarivorans aestuarii TaxID=1563703 RepID=A0ABU7G4L0_9ALTE|nr:hypothetical protein [Agarivorans aestuarii]MEE1674156.1 hypothetical protein [Agarivorans aestuarii]